MSNTSVEQAAAQRPHHILVADDDLDLRNLLCYCLEEKGYQVSPASNGQEALNLFSADQFDLIILDVDMPQLSGWDVCVQIRKRSTTPVMMVTAAANPEDIVFGLDLGADSYVTKPFKRRELVARVAAFLRRTKQKQQKSVDQPLRYGEIELDESSGYARKQGQDIRLSPTEFRLLEHFMIHPNLPISQQELAEEVWGYVMPEGDDFGFLRATIKRLRSKLEDNPSYPTYIKTIHGWGYEFGSANLYSPQLN